MKLPHSKKYKKILEELETCNENIGSNGWQPVSIGYPVRVEYNKKVPIMNGSIDMTHWLYPNRLVTFMAPTGKWIKSISTYTGDWVANVGVVYTNEKGEDEPIKTVNGNRVEGSNNSYKFEPAIGYISKISYYYSGGEWGFYRFGTPDIPIRGNTKQPANAYDPGEGARIIDFGTKRLTGIRLYVGTDGNPNAPAIVNMQFHVTDFEKTAAEDSESL